MTRRGVWHYLPLVVVGVLLAVVAVAADVTGPQIGHPSPGQLQYHGRHTPLPTPSFSPPPPPVGGGHSGSGGPVSGIPLVVLVALTIALAWGAVMLYLMMRVRDAIVFRRGRQGEPEPEQVGMAAPSTEDLREAVAASLAVLIEGDDPRAAVIACWLRLQALAEQAGVPGTPSDAPGDLVGRMLATHGLTGGGIRALHELTEVYRAARYAPHPVTESDRETARAALDRMRAELSAAGAAPVAGAGPS